MNTDDDLDMFLKTILTPENYDIFKSWDIETQIRFFENVIAVEAHKTGKI